MLATLPSAGRSNARNLSNEKEMILCINLVGVEDGKPTNLATARFYMARSGDGASPVYCALWIHGPVWTSGKGRANGYGYHKQSAALQDALDSAGITLYSEPDEVTHIDGVGSSAMRDALTAIGEALGHSADHLIVLEN